MIKIGIDTGVNTGWAMVHDGVLREVKTYTIIEAFECLRFYCKNGVEPIGVKIYIEDARFRKEPIYKSGAAMLQGVGSVKRDASIWQEFCEYHEFEYELVHPKNNRTKLSADEFKRLTGWVHKTNVHGRDAAMLVFGRK